jgi:hypothetical protein
VEVEEGSTITLPNAPSKSTPVGKYTFKGWSDGDKQYGAGEKYAVNADTTFTAVWSWSLF